MARSLQVPIAEAKKLKELWKADPTATVEDISKQSNVEELPRALLRYEDGYHFQRVLGSLVRAESSNDRRMKEDKISSGISVRWDTSLKKRRVSYLFIPQISVGDIRVMNGDEIRLSHPALKWECVGTVKGLTT